MNLINSSFDDRIIVSVLFWANLFNIFWFQVLKCQDFLFFFVIPPYPVINEESRNNKKWIYFFWQFIQIKGLRSSFSSRSFRAFSLSRSACSQTLRSAAAGGVGSAGFWGGQSESTDLLWGRTCALLCSWATESASRLLWRIDSTEGLK